MYIEPKTNIRLLSGVPLDTTYEHTLSWEAGATGVTAQYNYFVSKTKYNLTDYNYVRVANGVARVAIQAENLYDCNYMMFQNTAFGNKWFYAFVTDIVYLNNGTTEIRFTIDDMQTWYFNFELDDCFIEREHTATDVIGEHIEPEPVATGEYVSNGYNVLRDLSTQCVIASITISSEETASAGIFYDGVYSGTYLEAFPTDYGESDIEWINERLSSYAENPDQVVNLYMCPVDFLKQTLIHKEYNPIKYDEYGKTLEVLPPSDSTITKGVTQLDGYVPNNAKLYTYPFNYYSVTAGGSTLSLRYEYFHDLMARFRIHSTFTYPVQATIYPKGYKGVPSESIYKPENLQINEFPMCSWNMDAFKAYLVQNSVPIAINSVASAYNITQTANSLSSARASTVSDIAGILSQAYSASIQSDIHKGNFTNGGVDNAHGINTFFGGRMSISHQQAKIIDDFFTKYGYAINVVKKPNWRSRPHYNYIKTVNCTATGSIPSDSLRNICHLFDNGITFWKNPEEVGQYNSVNNTV